jgi:hypothetical protein
MLLKTKLVSVSDADLRTSAFLTPGSGISFFRIPDPTHISESLLKLFWAKNT